MKKETNSYIKEVILFTLLPTLFMGFILLFLQWNNISHRASFLEIASATCGIAFVLIIRNPNNYLGFPIGILSSLLLGIHFLQLQLLPTGILYLLFIPLQFYTMITWKKGENSNKALLQPSFLSAKAFLYYNLLLLPLSLVLFFCSKNELLIIRIIESVFVALNILPNILIIRKKTDAWFYWVLSNFLGGILFTYTASYFTALLHLVFIILNLLALIRWSSETPKGNGGWTTRVH